MTNRDRELGIDRAITRRDFLNGVAIGLGSIGKFMLTVASGKSRSN